MAVIHTIIANPATPSHVRHYLRENNHTTLKIVRSALEKLNYYDQSGSKLTIEWIKGHIGNRLHECADHQAAHIAFRRTSRRGPNPNYPLPRSARKIVQSNPTPFTCTNALKRVTYTGGLSHVK